MSNITEYIEVKAEEYGDDIEITIDTHALWRHLADDIKEEIMRVSACWSIISASLKYEMGRSLSTPSFNSSIHKLREMICTDDEFVNEMVVTFVKQILTEWAQAEQDKRAAERAYWKLYHATRDRIDIPCESGLDVRRAISGNERPRISSEDVREDIIAKFGEILGADND